MMRRPLAVAPLALLFALAAARSASATPLDDAVAAFEARTGARIVFEREALPPGAWYDRMPELSERRQLRAAKILLAEASKYPNGYLGAIGLDTVGVFSACVSDTGDGFRAYDADRRGYVYFGLWNGQDAIAAAYYNDTQLPLTFHHEVFHAVDAARDGVANRDAHFASDDARFARAVAGEAPYAAADLSAADLDALEALAEGTVLRDAVGSYAAKSAGEDQAETARHFMTTLPDALLQMAREPELPGSQRLLHLMTQYRAAVPRGPGVAWFVDVALGRAGAAPARANPYLGQVDAEIADPDVRAAIRRVQPAAVRFGNGSGVNLRPEGLVLTNAHVVKSLGASATVALPDGRRFSGRAVAVDATLDLALVALDGAEGLPVAPVAARAPRVGDAVVVIGQPGSRTPDGEPTGYGPFHVSTGRLRGFLEDPLGDQSLGRTKHDAWTYWGHSGSPLFNREGAIVALHNSWDSTTAMRHAVTWQAIVAFLAAHDVRVASR